MAKNPEVDAWLASYDNPMKPVVQKVRQIILGADRRIEECIKWQSPTFAYKGNLASFFPRAKAHATLMFHTGASIPGRFPSLEGTGGISRSMKIRDLAHAKALTAELREIVRTWCEMKDATRGGAAAGAKKTAVKQKAAKKKAVKKKAVKKKAVKKKAVKKKAVKKKAVKKKAVKKKAAKRKIAKKRSPASRR